MLEITLLEKINGMIWGVPVLILMVSTGLYLTIKTHAAQVRLFPKGVYTFLGKGSPDEKKSSSRAMWTALAATVGTGNLAGVAGAIALGGPGAVFWMWICGILGMITKFAEACLAVCYRQKNEYNEYVGGPMYMITNGMGHTYRWLACIYCFFGVVASFGVGNATQINTVIDGANQVLMYIGKQSNQTTNLAMGIVLAVLVVCMLLGGAKRIGVIAEKLVPFASIMYLLFGAGVLLVCRHNILPSVRSIISGAFYPKAITGGTIGSAFIALRVGASRGVFTNEAGMGTAAIAHSAADVSHPVIQGAMGIVEVFIDTIVICTMTALVILSSGIHITYGVDRGIQITMEAFQSVYGSWISIPITVALCLFALATVLGWSLYGGRCAQFLFGEKAWRKFVMLQGVTIIISSILATGTVWTISEIVNGLMAIPNLIALGYLSPELLKLLHDYEKRKNRHARKAHA